MRNPSQRWRCRGRMGTQMLRQTDARVFKKYSQMKLQMKREALKSLNRKAGEGSGSFDTGGDE
jgi:hypothetical protein